ncbi:hypothetical protein C7C46_02395 [Streptomyces tateyamensis]|uniref:Uncharacterized protein n=1 Tax=Streptomyces tateyamensis TaxID=565073 RepID=A0A2V4NNN9_9ACTN|nr:hypothetical protein C7C46_02395 [Streptomyces tateyamensis]
MHPQAGRRVETAGLHGHKYAIDAAPAAVTLRQGRRGDVTIFTSDEASRRPAPRAAAAARDWRVKVVILVRKTSGEGWRGVERGGGEGRWPRSRSSAASRSQVMDSPTRPVRCSAVAP